LIAEPKYLPSMPNEAELCGNAFGSRLSLADAFGGVRNSDRRRFSVRGFFRPR
jgi:hypothetical protein